MADINNILQYIKQYGYIFLAIIVFLEYLNLPGLPAGIIMPAAGILVKYDGLNFILYSYNIGNFRIIRQFCFICIRTLLWKTHFKEDKK